MRLELELLQLEMISLAGGDEEESGARFIKGEVDIAFSQPFLPTPSFHFENLPTARDDGEIRTEIAEY